MQGIAVSSSVYICKSQGKSYKCNNSQVNTVWALEVFFQCLWQYLLSIIHVTRYEKYQLWRSNFFSSLTS